jgi:hypothetical protein
VLRLVDLTHNLGTALVHDTAALPTKHLDMSTAANSQRAATLARLVADDLEAEGRRELRPLPPSLAQPATDTAIAAAKVRSDLDDITAALSELVQMRRLPTPS